MRKQFLKWWSLICVMIPFAGLALAAAPHLADWADLEALIAADDQVVGVYVGADGGAATVTLTPAGNPARLTERRMP